MKKISKILIAKTKTLKEASKYAKQKKNSI